MAVNSQSPAEVSTCTSPAASRERPAKGLGATIKKVKTAFTMCAVRLFGKCFVSDINHSSAFTKPRCKDAVSHGTSQVSFSEWQLGVKKGPAERLARSQSFYVQTAPDAQDGATTQCVPVPIYVCVPVYEPVYVPIPVYLNCMSGDM